MLTERKGFQFKAQDVRNVISNIKRSEEVVITAEESLEDIINSGGDVRYKKQAGCDNVDVLWIQTKDMRDQLKKCSPLVFECDTNFGTQVEGYEAEQRRYEKILQVADNGPGKGAEHDVGRKCCH